MSQTGAYAYAAQGYGYQQILEIYYPDVEIARRFGKAVVACVLFQLAIGKKHVKIGAMLTQVRCCHKSYLLVRNHVFPLPACLNCFDINWISNVRNS